MTIDDLFKKIDKLTENMTDIKASCASMAADLRHNTADLKEHMRRTNILEEKMDHIENRQIAHESEIKGVKKFFLVIASVVGVASTVIAIAKALS